MSQIAALLVVLGILGLFWLDRDRMVRTSPALWVLSTNIPSKAVDLTVAS